MYQFMVLYRVLFLWLKNPNLCELVRFLCILFSLYFCCISKSVKNKILASKQVVFTFYSFTFHSSLSISVHDVNFNKSVVELMNLLVFKYVLFEAVK